MFCFSIFKPEKKRETLEGKEEGQVKGNSWDNVRDT
jgi:hypothetical protein